ncbi:MAG: hypothetical protein ABSH21_08530 [Verrucomicrobiia bacterium]|jgi:hypothetical protein
MKNGLARQPHHERWAGQNLIEASIVKEVLAKQAEGTTENAGIDGVQRLSSFGPLHFRTAGLNRRGGTNKLIAV